MHFGFQEKERKREGEENKIEVVSDMQRQRGEGERRGKANRCSRVDKISYSHPDTLGSRRRGPSTNCRSGCYEKGQEWRA